MTREGYRGDHQTVFFAVTAFNSRSKSHRAARIRIRFVEWRARAGDGNADTVTFVEDLAHRTQVKGDFIYLAGVHKDFSVEALPESRPANGIDNQNGTAVWINVGHAYDEVRIFGRGGDENLRAYLAGPFDRPDEYIRGERPDLRVLFVGAGIFRAGKGQAGDRRRLRRIARRRL